MEQTLVVHFHLEVLKQLYHRYLKRKSSTIREKTFTVQICIDSTIQKEQKTVKKYPSLALESKYIDLEQRLEKNI